MAGLEVVVSKALGVLEAKLVRERFGAGGKPRRPRAEQQSPRRVTRHVPREVTRQIYQLVEITRDESNLIAQRFLDWFVTEQLEEVNTMSTLVGIIKRAGEDRLLHVEDYLAREGGPHAEGE